MTFGRRIAELAAEHPDKPALIFAPQAGPERTVTWREFDRRTNQIARLLAERGVDGSRMVAVGLWNCPEHFLFTAAAWKRGSQPCRCALPCRPESVTRCWRWRIRRWCWPAPTRGDIAFPRLDPAELDDADRYSDEPLPDETPNPGKAIGSGGSTGRSKIIVDRTSNPVEPVESPRRSLGMAERQIQLLAAPLYHNSPFLISYRGLALDHTLVVMERFDAEKAVELIERHRVSYAYLPPIIMRRIIMVPGVREKTRDLSSLMPCTPPPRCARSG